jgi:hypothetical protein
VQRGHELELVDERGEPRGEVLADPAGVLLQALAFERVEHGEADLAGRRAPAGR